MRSRCVPGVRQCIVLILGAVLFGLDETRSEAQMKRAKVRVPRARGVCPGCGEAVPRHCGRCGTILGSATRKLAKGQVAYEGYQSNLDGLLFVVNDVEGRAPVEIEALIRAVLGSRGVRRTNSTPRKKGRKPDA